MRPSNSQTISDTSREQMDIESLIQRGDTAIYADEYGVKTRRLFPWQSKVNTKRQLTEVGCMYVLLGATQHVDAHHHDEEEAFIVLRGSAVLTVYGQETRISGGDVAYIPRNSSHALRNTSTTGVFEMLDIYWDERGRSECTIPGMPKMLANNY